MNNAIDRSLDLVVTISGTAKDVLKVLAQIQPSNSLSKSAQLITQVKYASQRGIDSYEFPKIEKGFSAVAQDALYKLQRQRAVTDIQCEIIGAAINALACMTKN